VRPGEQEHRPGRDRVRVRVEIVPDPRPAPGPLVPEGVLGAELDEHEPAGGHAPRVALGVAQREAGESSFAFATAAGGRLWVVHTLGIDHAAVTAVDPSTGRILTHFGVGGFGLDALRRPGDLAVASGAVWVTLRGEGNIKRVDTATGALEVRATPGPVCGSTRAPTGSSGPSG
jgi:hypothetical protein